jgi:predicted enzyme related to lactoylglutathione lyase
MTAFQVTGDLDIGLFSDDAASVAFYENEVKLPFVETLRHSPTYEERFYSLGGSSLKINYSTDGMPDGNSGYRGLRLARAEVSADTVLVDPSGLPVTLTPAGEGVPPVAITCEVRDLDRYTRFLSEGFGAVPDGPGWRIGQTVLLPVQVPGSADASPPWSRGFNYVVVFVDDIATAHEALIELGAQHSVPPTLLPERCAFSWLRDPSGNWVELVQPAGGTRPLPEVAPIETRWREITEWRTTGVAFH